jgi:hypothetical protein
MGKVWVLDTETKGTGANMVPLERVTQKRSSPAEPVFVPRKRRPQVQPEAAPVAESRRFRVFDVMTRQELADGASVRETVEALKDVRSVVDVTIFVWSAERERWRMLTFDEHHTLWRLAHA